MIPTPSCRGASPLEALDPKPRRSSPSMIAQGAGVDARDLRAPREAVAFEAARAFGHVQRLGYPRRVATPQERRAARYILRTFAALGLGRRRETFPVPLLAREVGNPRGLRGVCHRGAPGGLGRDGSAAGGGGLLGRGRGPGQRAPLGRTSAGGCGTESRRFEISIFRQSCGATAVPGSGTLAVRADPARPGANRPARRIPELSRGRHRRARPCPAS